MLQAAYPSCSCWGAAASDLLTSTDLFPLSQRRLPMFRSSLSSVRLNGPEPSPNPAGSTRRTKEKGSAGGREQRSKEPRPSGTPAEAGKPSSAAAAPPASAGGKGPKGPKSGPKGGPAAAAAVSAAPSAPALPAKRKAEAAPAPSPRPTPGPAGGGGRGRDRHPNDKQQRRDRKKHSHAAPAGPAAAADDEPPRKRPARIGEEGSGPQGPLRGRPEGSKGGAAPPQQQQRPGSTKADRGRPAKSGKGRRPEEREQRRAAPPPSAAAQPLASGPPAAAAGPKGTEKGAGQAAAKPGGGQAYSALDWRGELKALIAQRKATAAPAPAVPAPAPPKAPGAAKTAPGATSAPAPHGQPAPGKAPKKGAALAGDKSAAPAKPAAAAPAPAEQEAPRGDGKKRHRGEPVVAPAGASKPDDSDAPPAKAPKHARAAAAAGPSGPAPPTASWLGGGRQRGAAGGGTNPFQRARNGGESHVRAYYQQTAGVAFSFCVVIVTGLKPRSAPSPSCFPALLLPSGSPAPPGRPAREDEGQATGGEVPPAERNALQPGKSSLCHKGLRFSSMSHAPAFETHPLKLLHRRSSFVFPAVRMAPSPSSTSRGPPSSSPSTMRDSGSRPGAGETWGNDFQHETHLELLVLLTFLLKILCCMERSEGRGLRNEWLGASARQSLTHPRTRRPERPVDRALAWLKPKPAAWKVADFGCGDAELMDKAKQQVGDTKALCLRRHSCTYCT